VLEQAAKCEWLCAARAERQYTPAVLIRRVCVAAQLKH